MESPEVLLAIYYLGLGFVAFLGWAGIAAALNEPLDNGGRTAWRRVSITLAVVGLLHPAVAFAARDIAIQVDRDDDGGHDASTRHLRLANWCAILSLVIAGALILTQMRGTGAGSAMQALRQAGGRA